MRKILILTFITFSIVSVSAQDNAKSGQLDSQVLPATLEVNKEILVYSEVEPILKEHKGAYASPGDGYIPYSKENFKEFINDSVKQIILEVTFNGSLSLGYGIYITAEVEGKMSGGYCLGIGKGGWSFKPYIYKLFGPHALFSSDTITWVGDKVEWERKDNKIKRKRNYRNITNSGVVYYTNIGMVSQPFVRESQKYIRSENSDQPKVEILFDVERDEFIHATVNGYGFDFSNNPFKEVWFKIPFKKSYNSRHKKISLVY